MSFLSRVDRFASPNHPFSTLRGVSPTQIGRLLLGESATVVAAVAAEFPVDEATAILVVQPDEVVDEVLRLLAQPPDLAIRLGEIEMRLLRRIEVGERRPRLSARGIQRAGDQLASLEQARVGEPGQRRYPRLAAHVDARRKENEIQAWFDRLAEHPGPEINIVLRQVESSVFAQFVQGEPEELQAIWLSACSPRVAQTMREEMDLASSNPRATELARLAVARTVGRLIDEAMISTPKVPDLTEAGTQPTMAEPI